MKNFNNTWRQETKAMLKGTAEKKYSQNRQTDKPNGMMINLV